MKRLKYKDNKYYRNKIKNNNIEKLKQLRLQDTGIL